VPPDVVVGSLLVGENQAGQPIQAVVKEIKEKVVVLDFNHPLAGKTLIFDVKVLSVISPKSE
jgi:FKBP-type peptidyl-prolyl cis-trans isomerase SlyD